MMLCPGVLQLRHYSPNKGSTKGGGKGAGGLIKLSLPLSHGTDNAAAAAATELPVPPEVIFELQHSAAFTGADPFLQDGQLRLSTYSSPRKVVTHGGEGGGGDGGGDGDGGHVRNKGVVDAEQSRHASPVPAPILVTNTPDTKTKSAKGKGEMTLTKVHVSPSPPAADDIGSAESDAGEAGDKTVLANPWRSTETFFFALNILLFVMTVLASAACLLIITQ